MIALFCLTLMGIGLQWSLWNEKRPARFEVKHILGKKRNIWIRTSKDGQLKIYSIKECHIHGFRRLFPFALNIARSWRRGRDDATPMSFSEMVAEPLGGSRWNFEKFMGHLLRNFWQKRPGQVRSTSYDVIRGTTSDQFFKEIVFSAV